MALGGGGGETYVAFVKTRSNTAPLLDCHRDGLRIGVFGCRGAVEVDILAGSGKWVRGG